MRRTLTTTALAGTPSAWADHMLRLARVLGGGEDRHLIILARNGQRDLPFQIHMVLPAHAHTAP
jgi:hypothetical protein